MAKKESISISRKQMLVSALILFVLALASIPSIYFYNENRKAQLKLTNPSVIAEEELTSLIEKVGKLTVLPTGEKPTLATVSDVNKLKANPFFVNAQNGDKVLIYSKAKKAYLYRPSINKIVEIAPLTVADQDVQGAPVNNPTSVPQAMKSVTPKAPYKVAILNGTGVAGLGGKIQNSIEPQFSFLKVEEVLNASKKNYPNTIVMNVSKRATKAEMNLLVQAVNGVQADLPEGESVPKGIDIAILLGSTPPTTAPSPSGTPTTTPEPTSTP